VVVREGKDEAAVVAVREAGGGGEGDRERKRKEVGESDGCVF